MKNSFYAIVALMLMFSSCISITKSTLREPVPQDIVTLHKAKTDTINFSGKVDFILAFYVVHEINRDNLFSELKNILKLDGKILIVEPNFHISKIVYEEMLDILEKEGFEIISKPKIFLSRAVLVKLNNNCHKA